MYYCSFVKRLTTPKSQYIEKSLQYLHYLYTHAYFFTTELDMYEIESAILWSIQHSPSFSKISDINDACSQML